MASVCLCSAFTTALLTHLPGPSHRLPLAPSPPSTDGIAVHEPRPPRHGCRAVVFAAASVEDPPLGLSVAKEGITSQVTFSGCGGLYCYFFGVAAYIQRHYDTRHTAFAGASAGTFPALLLAANIDVLNFTSTQLGLLRDAGNTWRGAPLYVWNAKTHAHMLDFLDSGHGPEAYKRVCGRFYVSMSDLTEWAPTIPIPTMGARGRSVVEKGVGDGGVEGVEEGSKMTNLLVNEWTSNRDLVDAMLASAHSELGKGYGHRSPF